MEFNDLIDYNILKMKDSGIHDSIMRRYDGIEELGKCGKREKGSSLGLSDTIFFFLVFTGGVGLSIFTLILEILWSSDKRRKRQTEKAQEMKMNSLNPYGLSDE